jgi:hypothetical protein
VVTAKVGEEYSYQVSVNRSLGDLTSRLVDNQQRSGYFDIEKPKFALVHGPEWLNLDEATGVLSGTPGAAGRTEVELSVTIDREVRKLDEKTLIWGREKVLETTTERVGTATQKFIIDVQHFYLSLPIDAGNCSLRHLNGRPQTGQVFSGRWDFPWVIDHQSLECSPDLT